MLLVATGCGGGKAPEVTQDTHSRVATRGGPAPALLDSAARRLVEFLAGRATFDAAALSDSVTLLVAPEGGGARRTLHRDALRAPHAWVVRQGEREIRFAPPPGLTTLTTAPGRHLRCREGSLGAIFPGLDSLPHVGTMLTPPNPQGCLQGWNVTFVFAPGAGRPQLVAAVYDQWEW